MAIDPTKLIDRMSSEAIPLLKDLQGNILTGHGRDYSSLLFLQFRSSPGALSEAKRWIQKFAEERVTSASRQLQEREDYRTLKIPGGLFVNFLLTSQGYRTLGVESLSNDKRFVAGMKTSQAEL